MARLLAAANGLVHHARSMTPARHSLSIASSRIALRIRPDRRITTAHRWRKSTALAGAPAFQCHDLAARMSFGKALRNLLGDAEQPLAPRPPVPDIARFDPRRDPEHDQVVHEVGAFPDHCLGIAV